MSIRSLRSLLLSAAAISTGLAISVALPVGANASQPGPTGPLTATNGTHQIFRNSGGNITALETVTDGSWAPDSSRIVYVAGNGDINSMRYNDPTDVTTLIDHTLDPTLKSHPSYFPDGSEVFWSEKDAANQPGVIAGGAFGFAAPITDDDTATFTHPDLTMDGASRPEIVFERQDWSWTDPSDHSHGGTAGGTPTIWGYTSENEDTLSQIVSDGRDPALSSDGIDIAFVRNVDGFDQIFIAGIDGSGITQVTTDPANHDNPAWAPHGSVFTPAEAQIAFNEGSNVYTINADGSGFAAVPGLTGLPAYENLRDTDFAFRMYGSDRFGTAIATSQAWWEDPAGAISPDDTDLAQSVVLSRSDTFADALSGSALAAAKHGPLLLTSPKSLNEKTAAEITRVLGDDHTKTVYLLGSTAALSQSVDDSVRALGYQVKRLQGPDRYQTSIAIANAINPHPEVVLAATGVNFPDALGAGAAAGAIDAFGLPSDPAPAVVLLTQDTKLPTTVSSYLNTQEAYANAHFGGLAVFGIGNQAATATAPYFSLPVAGPNRYATSSAVEQVFFDGAENFVGVATGANWPDALAGGAFMGTINGPMLLAGPSGLDSTVAHVLSDNSPHVTYAFLFGSSAVVSDGIMQQAGTLISGPGGFRSQAFSGNSTQPQAMRPGFSSPAVGVGTTSVPSSWFGSGAKQHVRTPQQMIAAAKALQASR